MDAPTRRAGVDLRIVLVGAVVLLFAVGGAAAWAYTTNADLERTRQTLATTNTDLETTNTSLADTQADLAKAAADVASEQDAIKGDQARVVVLEAQVSRKGTCIEAQAANLAEIRRILAMERANFDRTTSASRWYKAHAASNRALDLAISYMAKAYTSAAAGSYSTANSWLSKSNAQVRASGKQIDISNKEVDTFNAAVNAINKASDAFALVLNTTRTSCGG